MDNRLVVSILKLRKNIYEFYLKHDRIVSILLRGALALLLFLSINTLYGRSSTNMLIFAMGLAAICSALPMRMTYLGMIALNAVHLWQVSWDVLLFYLAIVLLAYLLVGRVKPETAVIMAFTPLFFVTNVPFLLPLLVGIFSSVFGVAAMAFGIVLYYISVYSVDVMTLLSSATAGDNVIAVKSILDRFMADTDFLLFLGAFIVAALVTYLLYHQSFDHAWYIGIAAGGLFGLVVYLGGGILFDIESGNMTYIFTVPVAIIIAFAVQFFRCVIDYSGAEKLEFEDDDYYYYVKAVPKVNVIVEDFNLEESVKERMAKKEEQEDEK